MEYEETKEVVVEETPACEEEKVVSPTRGFGAYNTYVSAADKRILAPKPFKKIEK